MKIIRAAEMGMCFGVRDALKIARGIEDPSRVTIHGELVHNPRVISEFEAAGFRQKPEHDRRAVASTPLVMITAHGISDAEQKRLKDQGKRLIDTTCPLVRRVHEAAQELASEGRHVLLIGKHGHVEVLGIVDDLPQCDVVASVGDVRTYAAAKLGVLSQTTMPTSLVDQIKFQIECCNPDADIRFVDTVCQPTKRRQQAMRDLVEHVDLVVVVGGQNSNNTKRLAEYSRQQNVPAIHVTGADELDPSQFENVGTVGLTAGTSTLDETIDEVHERLIRIAAQVNQQRPRHGAGNLKPECQSESGGSAGRLRSRVRVQS